MKGKAYLGAWLLFMCLLNSAISTAQIELYSEDFEAATSTFTLNTANVNSTTTGYNQWVINNNYTGGNGTYVCLNFPFPFTVTNTPAQPAAITNSPNSRYLHVNSLAAANSGILNACFLAADGLCSNPENYFCLMSVGVSTIGLTNVSFNFYWLCAGGPDSFGELYYSIDNGATFVNAGITYANSSTWQLANVSLPVFENQPSLRFGFRFVNNLALSGASDPSFAIDDITITAFELASNTITLGSAPSGNFCPGADFNVGFDATETYNAGNIFSVQLSDATGSFASPTVIGSITSTANSGSIPCTLPGVLPPGTGYVVRVVSSNPSVISNVSTPFTVLALPTAAISASGSTSVCPGNSINLTYTGDATTLQWQSSPNGTAFSPISGATAATLNTPAINAPVFFQIVASNACGNTNSNIIAVSLIDTLEITAIATPGLSLCTGPVTLTIPPGFSNIAWTNGATNVNFITVSEPGVYSATATSADGCPTLVLPMQVLPGAPIDVVISPSGNEFQICPTGSISFNGPAGFASYSWSNGSNASTVSINSAISNLQLTVTDANGCTGTSAPIEVTVQNEITIDVSASANAICSGVPVILTAQAGLSSYLWSSGQTNQTIAVSVPGTYTVQGSDANGCNGASAPITIIQAQNPISNFNYTQSAGFTLSFQNTSQNALTHLWIFDNFGTSTSINPTQSFPSNGVYYISLITSNECGFDTVVKPVVVFPLGFSGTNVFGDWITVFPNPVSNSVFIKSEGSTASFNVRLQDLSGRVMLERNIQNHMHQLELDVSTLPAGIYFLRLFNQQHSAGFKILKQ